MDPLVEAMWHNQAISDLPRLPDDILRAVIQNLDNCGVECLRRVSRKFIPLCDEEILSRPHTFQPRWKLKDRGGPSAWPRFEVFSGPWRDSAAAERQRLLQLLARDWYCEGCRDARAASDWDRRVEQLTRYLYCYFCEAEHPACLFSAQQRHSTTRRRRCIAHEGYIRLCQHDEGIVRWSKVSRIRQRLKKGVKNKRDFEICCEDISHVVPCAHTGTQRSGQRIFKPDCDDYHCIERPSPKLSVKGSKIWLYWTAHLPVESNGRPLTAVGLRPRIAEIRESCGRFLYPAMTSTEDVPEMRCFDPNDCDCVLLEGHENIERRFSSSLNSDRVCRLNTSRRLYPLCRSSSLWSAASLVDSIQRLLLTHKLGLRRKCGSSPKRHRARLDFNFSSGPGRSNVQCWPCHAGNSCLIFDYTRVLTIGCEGAIGVQWYQALDPDSYSLTEDEEGFGIYWCRQNECRNYCERVPGFSRIIRGAKYHRSMDAYWSSVII
ncbi:hypothetical protein N8I77_010539 [Diaporthe amygdali]|uniref:F-box domain-containing protein n=1 Tax=Phomopsis amygdali TaxID=1214568 RepID=A0AAD9S8N8_PHOAM|nr:hypothetical protein N8I77_010539 [Diaporthe amygdali]